MKISNSKKELARIISENGGWRDGYGFSAQDGDDCAVWFYDNAPVRSSGAWWVTSGSGLGHCGIEDVAKLPNWHQTILSREEYFHLYPTPDAEGWIEWNGGKCPVDGDVNVKFWSGTIKENPISARELYWEHDGDISDIIAYRLHKHEKVKSEFCESVMRSIPEPTAKPTIEQLAADYRNAKDYAESKQQEADDAKGDANEALRKLEIAGEAIGMLLSPITEKQEPGLVIAVQVGDEVECIESNVNPNKYRGMIGTAMGVDDTSTPYLVDFGGEAQIWCHEVKFIRRP